LFVTVSQFYPSLILSVQAVTHQTEVPYGTLLITDFTYNNFTYKINECDITYARLWLLLILLINDFTYSRKKKTCKLDRWRGNRAFLLLRKVISKVILSKVIISKVILYFN
jgi:hypothetical protein